MRSSTSRLSLSDKVLTFVYFSLEYIDWTMPTSLWVTYSQI